MEVITADPTRLAAPAEVLVGRRVVEILEPALAKSVLDCIRRALRDRHIQSLEYDLVTPKGQLRFDARVAAMDVEIEGRPCVIWVARDVTERRAQEKALLQAQKLESLGVLAGGIAHDFNNLLAAIQGHLSLGRLAVEDGQNPLDYFDRMEASIRRAADLARQLLAYAGRGSFQVEPIDLNTLVAEMTDILGVSKSKKVELEVRLAEALPLVQGDHTQLQQVVMNLVTNASESIGDRPGKVELATGVAHLDIKTLKRKFPGQNLEAGSFVTLTVKDDGCGMTPEVLGKIFDPFFTTKPTGRGLGLSALQGILRGHKAGIEIQSEPGRGTCISLYFPATLADGTPLLVPKALEGSDTELSGLLLLAEDEQTIRENSRQMAERLGFQVLEAADGEEAWSLFQAYESSITAVVLDLTMPRRGGAEVYSLIRARMSWMPVVLCSGYSREAIPDPTGNGEPRVFLQKPFSFRQFESSLREVLALAAPGSRH
jgi:signal transduction histidine kinase/CheY-like chemotaxis protein